MPLCLQSSIPASCAVLHLLWCWGELHILLKQYSKHYDAQGSFSGVTSALHHTNLTYIHPVLKCDEWAALFNRVDKAMDRRSQYILVRTNLRQQTKNVCE